MENHIITLEHENNLAHFAAMAYMAQVDGEFKNEDVSLLKDFAGKMGIQAHEYKYIMAHPSRPPINPSLSTSKRLKRIFAMFKIVFTNHKMSKKERFFIYRYALQIGFSKNNARKVINKSTAMFSGNFDFEDYDNFVKR